MFCRREGQWPWSSHPYKKEVVSKFIRISSRARFSLKISVANTLRYISANFTLRWRHFQCLRLRQTLTSCCCCFSHVTKSSSKKIKQFKRVVLYIHKNQSRLPHILWCRDQDKINLQKHIAKKNAKNVVNNSFKKVKNSKNFSLINFNGNTCIVRQGIELFEF